MSERDVGDSAATIQCGFMIGMAGGILFSIATVFMQFSMGETWSSINWPAYSLFCLAFYVAPLAVLGALAAALVVGIRRLFEQ